ncbi:MAG: acetoin utilization protein AcuC [Promethearchaeota archaeon]
MTDSVAVFYDERFMKYDLGPHHPLHQNRILLHHELSRVLGLFSSKGVSLPKFQPATDEQLRFVHTQTYIDQVRNLSQRSGYSSLDMGDTVAFPGAYDITRLMVGATLAGVDAVMRGKAHHSWNSSGGLHHAHADRAAGFCIFNDVAIACHYLKQKYKQKRIMYLDIDVHHADGVEEQFYRDPEVLTLSIHQTGRTLFPGTGYTHDFGDGEGKGYAVNLPLPPYTQDQQYLDAFEAIVPPIIENYKPQVIVMQSGVDTHFQDQLGNLLLTTHAFDQISQRVHELAHKHSRGRLIAVGGGGYSYYSVPRCWTIILARYMGVDVDNNLPGEWREFFKSITGLEAPRFLHDKEVPSLSELDQARVGRIVNESVSQVQDMVFPLLGISK